MNDRPLDKVLNALQIVNGTAPTRNGKSRMAICPVHDDHRPSLSVSEGDDGRALLHCHAGCTPGAIVAALGLSQRDLFPADNSDTDKKRRGRSARRESSGSTRQTSSQVFPTACGAVAALEKQLGPRTVCWTYHSANGEPVGLVVRWNLPDGKKDIRPVSHNSAGWVIGAMPKPRPVYGLPKLAEAQRVYIVEGEPAAEALRELGLSATTSAGGSKSANTTDWSPLAGRECVIWPDADGPGASYAEDVARLIGAYKPTATIKRIEPTGLPKGGDAVDFIAARRAEGMTDDALLAAIEQLADAATPIESEQVAPPIRAYQPFPVHVLPEPVRSFVYTGAKALRCDPAFIALPLLSALGSAIGNTRRIRLKRTWLEPPILWTTIVGESGTLKTPAFKLAVKPIRDRQADALRRHTEEMTHYEVEVLRYEKELAAWKRSKTANDDPPEKPQPPQAERCIVSDTTVEALAPILLANPRGLLLARDELAGWIGSFDRYVGGKGGADAAHWLSMHNGECIVVDRKTGQPRTIYVPSASVSITGGVQPGILDRVLGLEHRESGLLARLLLAIPPRRPKRWTEAEIPTSIEAAIAAIFDRLYGLEPSRDDNGDPCPRIVKLTGDGKLVWVAFYNEHAEEHADLSGDLSAAWSKLEGYAARLSLVIHFVRWAADDSTLRDPDAVDETSVAAGVALSRWFGHEARRVYAVWAESDDECDRRQLVEWITRHGGSVTVRDMTHGIRRYRGRSDEARAALDELEKAGYGSWTHPTPGPMGGRPSSHFQLVTAVTGTKTPAGDSAEPGSGSGDSGDTPADALADDPPDGSTPEACDDACGVCGSGLDLDGHDDPAYQAWLARGRTGTTPVDDDTGASGM